MTKAQKRAREVLRKYKLSTAPIQVDKIIKAENLNLDDWHFTGRVKEAYLGDSIGVKDVVDPRKKRELIAHALGHHFLHTGNHLYFETHDQFATFKQEYEAQCFAAELLMPQSHVWELERLSIKEFSDYFFVTEEFAKFRLELLKGN